MNVDLRVCGKGRGWGGRVLTLTEELLRPGTLGVTGINQGKRTKVEKDLREVLGIPCMKDKGHPGTESVVPPVKNSSRVLPERT